MCMRYFWEALDELYRMTPVSPRSNVSPTFNCSKYSPWPQSLRLPPPVDVVTYAAAEA